MQSFFGWLDRKKQIGPLILRLFLGLRLVYGVVDNVLSWEHMIKFKDFLQQFQFPFPLVCAIVSVYAQLIAGLLMVIGFKIRWAASLMIFNFLVAIVMVHRNDTIEQLTLPMMMLICSIVILFNGNDKYSLDRRLNNEDTKDTKGH